MKLIRQKFARFYWKLGNATQAAIKAGYSAHSARAIGSFLMTSPDVRAYLDKLNRDSLMGISITVEERKAILTRLATQLGNHNPADYINANGEAELRKEMPNPMAIQSIKRKVETTRDGGEAITTDLRLRDPSIAIKAIDTLNRMEGLYGEDNQSGVMVQMVIVSPDGSAATPLGNPINGAINAQQGGRTDAAKGQINAPPRS